MKRQILLVVPLALVLAACATTGASSTGTTSNPVAGSTAVSAGSRAIGAYGATGTSDDVRGRSGSSGASTLTGRANLAGSDSGTRDDATDADDTNTDPPRD